MDFAPNDRTQVATFLKDLEWEKTPLGAFVVGQRKQKIEKQKLVEDARKQEDKKRKEAEEEERDIEIDEDEDEEHSEEEEEGADLMGFDDDDEDAEEHGEEHEDGDDDE